jgi:hypothetical protein
MVGKFRDNTSEERGEKHFHLGNLHILKAAFLVINTLALVVVQYLILDGEFRLLFFLFGSTVFVASSFILESLFLPLTSKILAKIIEIAISPLVLLLKIITAPLQAYKRQCSKY